MAVARNLVPTPRFTNTAELGTPGWQFGEYRPSEGGFGFDGGALAVAQGQSKPYMVIDLGVTWEDGARYAVTVRMGAKGAACGFGLGAAPAGAYRPFVLDPFNAWTTKGGNVHTVPAPSDSISWYDIELTCDPAAVIEDAQGNPVEKNGAPLVLAVWGNVSSNWDLTLSHARVDATGTAAGYFDGDGLAPGDIDEYPDLEGAAFGWEGDPFNSVSTGPELADPDPDPDPGDDDDDDPPLIPGEWFASWENLSAQLAPRVAAYVGRPGDTETTDTAAAQLPVIAEYVRGYTRGRGWTGDRPAGPLMAVIMSAAARLVVNPEQVSSYQANDYSERPAVLAGYTLAELGVLKRYRVISA